MDKRGIGRQCLFLSIKENFNKMAKKYNYFTLLRHLRHFMITSMQGGESYDGSSATYHQ